MAISGSFRFTKFKVKSERLVALTNCQTSHGDPCPPSACASPLQKGSISFHQTLKKSAKIWKSWNDLKISRIQSCILSNLTYWHTQYFLESGNLDSSHPRPLDRAGDRGALYITVKGHPNLPDPYGIFHTFNLHSMYSQCKCSVALHHLLQSCVCSVQPLAQSSCNVLHPDPPPSNVEDGGFKIQTCLSSLHGLSGWCHKILDATFNRSSSYHFVILHRFCQACNSCSQQLNRGGVDLPTDITFPGRSQTFRNSTVVTVKDLCLHFPVTLSPRHGSLHAMDQIHHHRHKGGTLGL